MISIYDVGNENFSQNGDAVLTPTKCSHRQVAAGKYDLTIKHPMDPDGKWKHIQPEAIIKAPVPEERIETAVSGLEADLYRTNTDAALREGCSEPYAVTYQTWTANRATKVYAVGDKVTFQGQNYEMIALDPGGNPTETQSNFNHRPDFYPQYWSKIANYVDGAAVIVSLKSGTDLYYIEAAETTGWAYVCTVYGLEGYIKTSQITYISHLTPAETAAHLIREQLFRVRTVNIETKNRQVTATAEHVSYDLRGVLMENTKITRKSCAVALAWIEQGFMIPYRGTIATNMTSDDDGLFTGEFKGKNGINALLDPDTGVVGALDAEYRRDNWDVFVMKTTDNDRGFQLRYRKNMIGVTWNIKGDSLITRVVPVAKDENGDPLYLDNNGVKWVDSDAINNYPVIRMEQLRVNGQVGKDDGSETATNWTTATLRAEMERQAQNRFDVDHVDAIQHEITVDFEMLGDCAEYPWLKSLENVLIYDKVKAIHDEIGLSVQAQVTEIEFDCIREKVTAIKLSTVRRYAGRTVSGYNVFDNAITGDKLTDDAIERAAEAGADQAAGYTNEVATNLYWWVTNNFEPRT